MRVVRKSLARKVVFLFLIFAVVLGVMVYHLSLLLSVDAVYWLVGYFGLVMFSVLVFYYLNVIRPLRKVVEQMQALLLGQSYKEVMSYRMDEIGVVAYFFNQVTKSIGKISGDLKEHDRMLDELSVASQLQKEILPAQNPEVEGLTIVAKSKPLNELGGDSFNVFRTKERVFVYIGDVTGHGAAAALIMAMVNTLIGVFVDINDSPYKVLVDVNRYIKTYVKRAMFMTLVLLSYDYATGKISYAGAGHENIIIYRKKYGECEVMMSGGIALGMVPDNSNLIKEINVDLEDGDFIILYSDGIVDAKNTAGDLYGLDRLKMAVKEYAQNYQAAGLNHQVARDVAVFMGNTAQEDDMTLIVIQKGEPTPEEKSDINFSSTKWVDNFA
ncbi:hypothetical protein CVV38_03030 [Candidatus Peregrinibacteria bacterium HGW-Peregrinibacteria-1]|jgi:serine phosphatase RsbU (regulator of sigma subunit)|nr:MAG: hypothetical protein CVV38_03030 [Candidatus Peregrinibacteria bacterium HGW-Peregrinibacteria-1]